MTELCDTCGRRDTAYVVKMWRVEKNVKWCARCMAERIVTEPGVVEWVSGRGTPARGRDRRFRRGA
jgi:hypothetical protein